MIKDDYDFDYLIIGSGFGGSVSAHRLSEKGYSVAVMEMGKRWEAKDFPKPIGIPQNGSGALL
jgi:cholesterol oxidase